MKNITILGSTGSIGTATLEVIRRYPDKFRVVGLTAGRNIKLFQRQIEEFRPLVVAVADDTGAGKLRENTGFSEILSGPQGIQDVAAYPEADFVLSAISGSAGLLPTLSAIMEGKTIGLANKETLVMAGPLIKEAIAKYGARLIPVDSEHSAIFQCMHGYDSSDIKRLVLTASGGPFHGRKGDDLKDIKPEDALNHPTWQMGKKITIDSATLMNKGLEVIEAHYLFGFASHDIDVIIHPQSIVHSLVEFLDGALIAHMSHPDMRGPIAYALSYPERLEGVLAPCHLYELGALTFERPDIERFPCLRYAYEALNAGGTATAVLNAVNEMAVEAFIEGRMTFHQIPVIIEKVLNAHEPLSLKDIETVMWADAWARRKFGELVCVC
ncbi:1-deoxy-D-xylulose 5-phosphate reductoisomerase [bacterium BMS3Bbin07]|nr:1-deoxy-D-xylulose 5-phosphate reductoisomerase [bacterium BMS3Bbin07]HDH01653.1 1-deoxy-D-xylulose-5-phosphate reductoisomerase [Nitrospirota bacterium]